MQAFDLFVVTVLFDASSQRHCTFLSSVTCANVGLNQQGCFFLDAGVGKLELMTRREATKAYPEAILRYLQEK